MRARLAPLLLLAIVASACAAPARARVAPVVSCRGQLAAWRLDLDASFPPRRALPDGPTGGWITETVVDGGVALGTLSVDDDDGAHVIEVGSWDARTGKMAQRITDARADRVVHVGAAGPRALFFMEDGTVTIVDPAALDDDVAIVGGDRPLIPIDEARLAGDVWMFADHASVVLQDIRTGAVSARFPLPDGLAVVRVGVRDGAIAILDRGGDLLLMDARTGHVVRELWAPRCGDRR